MRVYTVRRAPSVDPIDRRRADLAHAPRAVIAEQLTQLGGAVPERVDEPAVAPARAVAAKVAFDQQDPYPTLGEMPGGPHPEVTTANDEHVGTMVTGRQRRLCRNRAGIGKPVAVSRTLHGLKLTRAGAKREAVRPTVRRPKAGVRYFIR